jgi:hypothetical protein
MQTYPSHLLCPHARRTAVMNASAPLQKSILMDYAGKAQRPMWSSLEAMAAFGWSGSAALGGWLIQQYGFDVNFSITAAMQVGAGAAAALTCCHVCSGGGVHGLCSWRAAVMGLQALCANVACAR